jgi:hypothetical protein
MCHKAAPGHAITLQLILNSVSFAHVPQKRGHASKPQKPHKISGTSLIKLFNVFHNQHIAHRPHYPKQIFLLRMAEMSSLGGSFQELSILLCQMILLIIGWDLHIDGKGFNKL